MEFTEHDLRAALADPAVLEPYGLDYNQAMALFLDDTYEVYWTTSPQELMQNRSQLFLFLERYKQK